MITIDMMSFLHDHHGYDVMLDMPISLNLKYGCCCVRIVQEFGLDDKAFRSQFLGQFPAQVFDVPVMCCQLDPMAR